MSKDIFAGAFYPYLGQDQPKGALFSCSQLFNAFHHSDVPLNGLRRAHAHAQS